ncbi:M56 family metallopeptidase [Flavobacterium tiangeerense]|uniref:M56 family metallopeptidase n=1 Tax=Flavobacterium tiangeerense TaxID=459471 RepID=UPI0011A75846|nr:M56 family metallopeptidase [Flavobacterium tiangeerense]
MTDFLIKSTLSLVVLLGVYHFLLEKEKMHRFNRFYLLFALVFSMVIPFITIEVVQEIAQPTVTAGNIRILQTTAVVVEETNYTAIALWGLYGLVTLVLALRFMRNVIQISKKMKSNTPIAYQNAQLVLVPEKTLPHTFLNTIFINETEYNNREVEAELYTHELTHVTQKHTLDILFIEVLKTVFWFNPIFIFYKKSIQLNHEFLADEKVVHSYNNVPFYQSLLLSKANANPTFYLASNLNYLITKKRLLMMTKTTSSSKSFAKKIILIPLFTGLVNLMCTQTIAQSSTNNNTTIQSEIKKRDVYYKGVRLIVKDDTKKVLLDKKYEALTPNEKRFYISNVPPETSMKKPTQKEFDSWTKDPKFSGLFKGKKLNNIDLKKHDIKEIAGYIRFYSPSRNGKPYDIDLNHYALFTNSEREMIIKKSRKSVSYKVIEKTIKAGTFSNPVLIRMVERNT